MSCYCSEEVVRFSLGKFDNMSQVVDLYYSRFNQEENSLYDDHWEPDPKLNGGIRVVLIDNEAFCDYVISSKWDVYDIDVSVPKDIFDLAKCAVEDKLGHDVSDGVYRALMYHNGGCIGLSEVK